MTDRTAKLNTKSFRDVPLHQLTLEEVVAKFKDGEKKRHTENDPDQQVVDRFVRATPSGP